MKASFVFLLIILLFSKQSIAQSSYPWDRPLNMAWSADGINFGASAVFQDSAGVPSVLRWKGDTLVAVFQWFRLPKPSPSWDRVAVKFSYDKGINWTSPVPVVFSGLPSSYQRPFDPTLAVINKDSLRIYFSSGNGMPKTLDSTVNTYSAISADGINFDFESDARVDVSTLPVIDPAVIYFNNSWHYAAPAGKPQDGAYHYVSPDGLHFSAVPKIMSDSLHNWTGNYMKDSDTEMRFYGSGKNIWYNASINGGVWKGYTATNVEGGDPSVVKIDANNYLMIYVGKTYATHIALTQATKSALSIYPNPSQDKIQVECTLSNRSLSYSIIDFSGKILLNGVLNQDLTEINISSLLNGQYQFILENGESFPFAILK